MHRHAGILTSSHARPLARLAKRVRGIAALRERRPAARRSLRGVVRFGALLAGFGMFLGWMEVAIPDVHDGHGTAQPERDGWVLSHGHPPAPAEAPGHAPQSPHTCHCIHAHAPALPTAAGDPRPPATHALHLASTERSLASVAPEPHFRPPVA